MRSVTWIVLLNRTVEVVCPGTATVTLTADDMLDGGAVFPGFRLRVGDLFA